MLHFGKETKGLFTDLFWNCPNFLLSSDSADCVVLADDRFRIICAEAQSNIIQGARISKPDTDSGKSSLFLSSFQDSCWERGEYSEKHRGKWVFNLNCPSFVHMLQLSGFYPDKLECCLACQKQKHKMELNHLFFAHSSPSWLCWEVRGECRLSSLLNGFFTDR